MTYTTDLRAAVEQRRAERRRQQAEQERRARQLALEKATKQRADWIAALRADKGAVRTLALFGLRPEDATIEPERYHIYLHGQALIADGVLFTVAIVQSPQGATYHYANVACACLAANYEREYRGLTTGELSDRILDAAEEALKRLTAEQESA
jgi:hypothetical protein